MTNFLQQANLVDLEVEELKEYLGHVYHSIRNTEESKKNDVELARLAQVLKNYVDTNYTVKLKELKLKMKAAREVAKLRGIEWKPK